MFSEPFESQRFQRRQIARTTGVQISTHSSATAPATQFAEISPPPYAAAVSCDAFAIVPSCAPGRVVRRKQKQRVHPVGTAVQAPVTLRGKTDARRSRRLVPQSEHETGSGSSRHPEERG